MRHRRFRGRVRDCRREPLRNEGGSALVEFAIAALIFFLLLFGIMECSRAVWMYGTVAHVAKEGARYAIVQGSDVNSTLAATQSAVQTYVQTEATNFGIGQVTVTFPTINGCNASNIPPACIVVQVSCQFQPVLSIILPNLNEQFANGDLLLVLLCYLSSISYAREVSNDLPKKLLKNRPAKRGHAFSALWGENLALG